MKLAGPIPNADARLSRAASAVYRLQRDFAEACDDPISRHYGVSPGPEFYRAFDSRIVAAIEAEGFAPAAFKKAIEDRTSYRWLYFNLYVGMLPDWENVT